MYPLVLMKRRALAEAAPTISTAVGLLPSVDTQVGGEGRALREGSATVRTAMWPFPSVYGPVLAQGGSSTEGLAAIRATERLFTSVSVQVLHQSGTPGKTLPAHTAAMTLICSWNSGVDTTRGLRVLGQQLQVARGSSKGGVRFLRPSLCRKHLLGCLSLFPWSLPFLLSAICSETKKKLRL